MEESQEAVNKPQYRPDREQVLTFDRYKSLCKDGINLTESYKSKLFCVYSTMKNPYLYLMPAKQEIFHLDPKIILYHDIIRDHEIEELKRLAADQLNPSKILNQQLQDDQIWSQRVSKVAWIAHNETPITSNIIRRVSYLTGLDPKNAEQIQVANYGIGGHFVGHIDATDEQLPFYWKHTIGDRLATLLFYFSDVTLGGATVFPKLDLAVNPVKGSAAFWYNLHWNGTGNWDTWHAACPVLLGNKWAGNLWIHEYDQMFKRPCPLIQG